MSNYREARVAQQIRDEIGSIIQKEIEFPEGALVTVTRAEVSSGRADAVIFVSVIPTKFADEVMKELKTRFPYLQGVLGKKMKIRPMPRLHLRLDAGEERAARIEEIILKDNK